MANNKSSSKTKKIVAKKITRNVSKSKKKKRVYFN